MRFPAIPGSEPSAEELRFVFRSGRLSLAFCATVGERWRRSFERLFTPGHLTRWYAEASVAGVPVPVTGPDLAEARAVREAVYRTAKALLGGQLPAGADEEVINRAGVRPAVPGPQPPGPSPLVFQQRLRWQGTRRRLPPAPTAPRRNPLILTSTELAFLRTEITADRPSPEAY